MEEITIIISDQTSNLDLLQVIGTFVLAGIALAIAFWGEPLRRWSVRPLLTLNFEEPAWNWTQDKRGGWYYLLKVSNKRETQPATNVRLNLIGADTLEKNGKWHQTQFSGPVQVCWRWPESTSRHITVGPEEYATIFSFIEGEKSGTVNLIDPPLNTMTRYAAGWTVRFHFQAVSDYGKSNILVVEVHWDGNWSNDLQKMKKHLTVDVIS